MCGIVGVVFKDAKQTVNTPRLEAARDALTHRGPDAAGLWQRPGVALGHRRLAILDLSPAPGHGQQPVADSQGAKALTYNGEVYNYRELMQRYQQRGHTFQSTCDTELVFHALATDGPDAIHDFHGMFALAFYEHAERKLLLVRDRLGQKPLYYHDTGGAFIFASELKAILAYTGERYALDPAAVEQFFTRGYVPAPRTIFQGIHKLPAGCKLTLDANPWTHEVEPWWDAEPQDLEAQGALTDAGVVDTLDELLTQSVSDRLVSDVPIGTLLSGGIDSSLITAMASKTLETQGKGRVSAFTIGFDESEQHNEMPYAEMVAKQYGCDWHPRTINQNNQDWLAELDDASRFYDEPFGNFTVTAQRTLSTLCREELTVVLTGQGGDELTAGYPGRYNWVAQTEAQAADASKRSQYATAVDDVLNHLNKTSFVTWPGALSQMLGDNAKQAIAEAHGPDDAIAPFWGRFRGWPDRLGNVLYTDAKTNLPDYLVCIEERASMSASLEARNPLLDHRVVEFLLSLPMRYKVRPGNGPMTADGLQNKWVLHALAKRYLPAEAFDRPKRGFTPPIQQWMQRYAPSIADLFRETESLTAGLYSPAWQGFLNAGRYTPQSMMPVYYALVFGLWARRYAEHIEPIATSFATPGRAMSAANPRIAPGKDSPSHRTFREQSPADGATARWFCQMLGNLPDAGTLQLTGDPTGFYADLAKRSGYRVVGRTGTPQRGADIPVCHSAQPKPPHLNTPSGLRPVADRNVCHTDEIAHALVGLNAVSAYAAQPSDDNAMLLAFIPFDAHEQQQVQQALQQLNTHHPIQGHQQVPVGEGKAVLIARCASRSAMPAPA
ncbi:asparagine synthase (glutamine-hydrolyzing) [Phycisphaeraceae bacterium D3-23]